jgi:hypothetical protein
LVLLRTSFCHSRCLVHRLQYAAVGASCVDKSLTVGTGSPRWSHPPPVRSHRRIACGCERCRVPRCRLDAGPRSVPQPPAHSDVAEQTGLAHTVVQHGGRWAAATVTALDRRLSSVGGGRTPRVRGRADSDIAALADGDGRNGTSRTPWRPRGRTFPDAGSRTLRRDRSGRRERHPKDAPAGASRVFVDAVKSDKTACAARVLRANRRHLRRPRPDVARVVRGGDSCGCPYLSVCVRRARHQAPPSAPDSG